VAQEFKQGDKVEWNTPQGKTRGTVKKKLTSDTRWAGRRSTPQKTTPLPRREREERQGWFGRARRFRAGIEGRISVMKRRG
jgi:hypothetical protein